MKVVMINSGNNGSTGNIMLGIAETARKRGYTVYTSCANGRSMRKKNLDHHIFIGSRWGRNLHIKLAQVTGLNGMFSIIDTFLFLRKLKHIHPDLIHLHNLHNCYVNLPMLFRYMKREKIAVVWTLHDCWPFTGQCPYFTVAKCTKWIGGCYECPQYRQYPASCLDQTRSMWKRKKRWFTHMEKMVLVTPSKWLEDLVHQSFLGEYPTRVIHNGIDLRIFHPTQSNFRKKYGLLEKKIVLGVAMGWEKRKGLDVFVELSRRLDTSYQIVLVGTTENIDTLLPKNILSIHCTQDQKELAEIYTSSDVFLNPTREENYPTVNMEALACGVPVLTFATGGSPEMLDDSCGIVVCCDHIDVIVDKIKLICEKNFINKDRCIEKAKAFDQEQRMLEYMALYQDFMDSSNGDGK